MSIQILGVYIGDQLITVDELTTYQGKRVAVAHGRLTTTSSVSALYKVDDLETTYFIPEDHTPLYYERTINEGNWHDHIRFEFNPAQRQVVIAQKYFSYRKDTLQYSGTLRNYFTLISSVRALDYDAYIASKQEVTIDYLYGTQIKHARFSLKKQTIDFKGRKEKVAVLSEIGGIGMNFYIRDDAERVPLRMVVPAFDVSGFKTISVYAELKEFQRGTQKIAPDFSFGSSGSRP